LKQQVQLELERQEQQPLEELLLVQQQLVQLLELQQLEERQALLQVPRLLVGQKLLEHLRQLHRQ
jgi:hypothetical protein